MISFKSFVSAIQNAIMGASDTLMDKNLSLIDRYFDKDTAEVKDSTGNVVSKATLIPKTVTLNYPQLNEHAEDDEDIINDYQVKVLPIEVPLITLVPLTMPQIEKATLTAEFELEIVNGELQLNFPNSARGGLFKKAPKTTRGKLEIILSPQESSEGLKMLIESYESFLKRQLS